MFKKILLFSAPFVALLFTSCLNSDTSEQTYTTAGYYTIAGSLTEGYTLYCDFGGKILPSNTAVTDLTGSEGFGNHHRAIVYCSYKDEELSQDQMTITGGTLTQIGYLPEREVLSTEAATENKVNDTDSIFEVISLKSAWAYRGYLTAVVSGYYSYNSTANIVPSLNAVLDESSLNENEVAVDLYYNRHSAQDATKAGPAEVITSFTLEDIESQVPGYDTISVTLRCKGATQKVLRVGRRDFHGQ